LAGALPAVSGNGRGWERAHNTFQGAVRLTGEGLLRDEAAAGVFHGKEGGDGRAPPGGPVQRGKGPSECRNRSRKRRRRCSREELRRESPEEGDLVAAGIGEEALGGCNGRIRNN